MKLPSIGVLVSQIRNIIIRFPFLFIITLLAVIVAYILPDANAVNQNILARILCFCLLAFTLSLSVCLYGLSKKFSYLAILGFQVAAIVISVLIMYWLNPEMWEKDIIILLLFVGAFHLAVSYAAFLNNEAILNFWDFNKILFLKILTAALYSSIITLGLFAALAAIDNLFEANIRSTFYLRTFLLIGIGFNTLFFLGGLPDVRNHNYENQYPKGLKIFAQYVLIPLLIVYLVILLIYEGKIMLEWSLPKGYVSMLILGYAVFGILSLLLVFPIKDQAENKWIKWFSKFFYVMMIPLLVLLTLAIYKRVTDYGITEKRYIIIMAAIWLSGITIYFLVSTKQNIKIIPISLSIILIISTIGPQSAASVSKNSQVNRLKKLTSNPDNSKNAKQEASVIIRYLIKNHGLSSLQPLTTKNITNIQTSMLEKMKNENSYQIHGRLIDTAYAILNIKDLKDEFSSPMNKYFRKDNQNIFEVKGFEAVYHLIPFQREPDTISVGNKKIRIVNAIDKLEVSSDNEKLQFNLNNIFSKIVKKYEDNLNTEIQVPDSLMSAVQESDNLFVKLQIIRLNLNAYRDSLNDNHDFEGFLLIRKK